jgi:hypothetical protein
MSKTAMPTCFRFLSVAVLAVPVLAEEPAVGVVDKSQFHLFNPTPKALMRELSTDRPDQTESPYTVDAGHVQLEWDLANATFDRDRSGGGDVSTRAYGVGGVNAKIGLLNNVDLQLVLDGHVSSRVTDRVAGTVARDSGFGEMQTRLKINLWGNDGGRTALGIMPFAKWPLPKSGVRNGEIEGGVILPFSMDLGAGWGLGAQTEVDIVSDGLNGHDFEYFNTLTVGRDLFGSLAFYLEWAALVTPESGGEWQGQVDLGFTYGIGDNTQLDLGCNFGVTDSAPDYSPFLGLTVRF